MQKHIRFIILAIFISTLFLASCKSTIAAKSSKSTEMASTVSAIQTSIAKGTPYFATSVAPNVALTYRSGQTFILWKEHKDLQGEVYRIYRSAQPITQANLSQATLLGTEGHDSARFYANRYLLTGSNNWQSRFTDRYVIQDFGEPISEGTGLLVWTLSTDDFGGATSGNGYYAVTVTPAGGNELLASEDSVGPISEAVDDPLPVEIHSMTDIKLSEGAHVFIQYMNLHNWNPTFHAPNITNDYYGLNSADPSFVNDLQYAYDYVVYEPTPQMCGGTLPDKLPVLFWLHGWRGNQYKAEVENPALYCAYIILPEDETDTWYFGFAQNHDYRQNAEVTAGDVIVNYTEQRVLRMLYDLERKPLGPAVDPQRVYVTGESMGGSGSLAFAERYPNIFAAAYASQPMTDFLNSGVTAQDWVADISVKWGAPEFNLPIAIDAPNHWADNMQKYNGTGVWDWQNFLDSVSGVKIPSRLLDEMAPIGINMSSSDAVITWATQGEPLMAAFNSGSRVWAGFINDDKHEWQYYKGLPPSMAPVPYSSDANFYTWVPFWNLTVIKDETVPGFSNNSLDSSAAPGGYFNQRVLWSSSWNPWDGAPIDQPDLWQLSFCPVNIWSTICGTSREFTVDITPRRMQNFIVNAGASYDWQNQRISDGVIVAAGVAVANENGLLTIPDFYVSVYGNRLIIKPHVQ